MRDASADHDDHVAAAAHCEGISDGQLLSDTLAPEDSRGAATAAGVRSAHDRAKHADVAGGAAEAEAVIAKLGLAGISLQRCADHVAMARVADTLLRARPLHGVAQDSCALFPIF